MTVKVDAMAGWIGFYEKNVFSKKNMTEICNLGYLQLSRNQSAHPAFERSCQNELVRSNNFDVNIPVTMCHELEGWAKNYYYCKPIFKIRSLQ